MTATNFSDYKAHVVYLHYNGELPSSNASMAQVVESASELHYFHTSPVRGQLEPYDETTRAGWRFLQCSETPDELKVLLPPMTASMYAQLLKAELSELDKVETASWGRILEIRRLKDRMIKKCRKHSQSWALRSRGPSHFRTVAAPPDFRVREMEKWLNQQEMVEDATMYHMNGAVARDLAYCDGCQWRPHETSRHKLPRGPLGSSLDLNGPTPPSQQVEGSSRGPIQSVRRPMQVPGHQPRAYRTDRNILHAVRTRDSVFGQRPSPSEEQGVLRHQRSLSGNYSDHPGRVPHFAMLPAVPSTPLDNFCESRPVSPTRKSKSRSTDLLIMGQTSRDNESRDAHEHIENGPCFPPTPRPLSPPPLPHLFRPSIPRIYVNGVPVRDDDNICVSATKPLSEEGRVPHPQMVQSFPAEENSSRLPLQRKSSVKRHTRESDRSGKTVRWIEDLDCEELRALCQRHQDELRKCIDDLNTAWEKLAPNMQELKQIERIALEAEDRLRFVVGQLEQKERLQQHGEAPASGEQH